MASANSIFSSRGRLSKRMFWPLVLSTFKLKICLVLALIEWPAWKQYQHSDWLLIFVAAFIGKRMHDFGMSAVWGWLAVAVFSFALPIVAIFLWPPSSSPNNVLDAFPPWVGLLSGLPLLIVIIVVGLKAGDAGPNKYGEASS